MAVQFRCPCGATLRSNESIAGRKITGPKCGTQLQIKPSAPLPAQDPPDKPAPQPSNPPRSIRLDVRDKRDTLGFLDWILPFDWFIETRDRSSNIRQKTEGVVDRGRCCCSGLGRGDYGSADDESQVIDYYRFSR
mgnify:CR=1 FL=1